MDVLLLLLIVPGMPPIVLCSNSSKVSIQAEAESKIEFRSSLLDFFRSEVSEFFNCLMCSGAFSSWVEEFTKEGTCVK